jgi:hypothetical protein
MFAPVAIAGIGLLAGCTHHHPGGPKPTISIPRPTLPTPTTPRPTISIPRPTLPTPTTPRPTTPRPTVRPTTTMPPMDHGDDH